jgi:transposase
LEEYLRLRNLAVACSSESEQAVKKTRSGNLQARDAKPKRRRRNKGMCLEDRPVLEPNAAGIDVGAREMFVAVPPGRDQNPVRVFATFTEDLERLTDWLEQCGVTTVALESTGVYWIPLFEILEQRGIRPCLVNARHMKNVPGRRTDWHDRADPAATPQRIGLGGQPTHAAHAQGADANEPARRVKNRAGHLFRMAAFSLHHSLTPLGNYLRRMKAKLGPEAATIATAHKIAVIFYTMVKNQVEYDETLWTARDVQRERRFEAKLKRQAKQLGYELVPIEPRTA